MTKRKTHEEFIREIKKKYGDEYEVLGKYVNNHTKIKVLHTKCEYEWKITPHNLLTGKGCPVCGGTKKKTHEQFKQEIYDKYGDEYTVLGKYKGVHKKILVKHNCKECNFHEWETTPANLLTGYGCPVCSGRTAKLGINTIWDTDRWMIDLGVSEEDAKRYTSRSGQKITVKCPDCGKEKKIRISSIYTYKSISCSCGDGKSYPEKFIMNVLEQLNIDFETEYKPNWIKPKRYDFYIPKFNMIIEAHGGQHYDKGFKSIGGRTFEEEQANDKYKKDIALANGIKHYVELDCRNSNLEWIKNSILNSELAKLFDLSKISWNKCAEFANKNIVKEVCNYWNNRKENETISDLVKMFKLEKNTIAKYLKKGTKLGWCTYDYKEEMRKRNTKKVEIFKDNQSLGIFESYSEVERQSEKLFGVKLLKGSISSVCRGVRKQYNGFTFKYIEEDKKIKWGE